MRYTGLLLGCIRHAGLPEREAHLVLAWFGLAACQLATAAALTIAEMVTGGIGGRLDALRADLVLCASLPAFAGALWSWLFAARHVRTAWAAFALVAAATVAITAVALESPQAMAVAAVLPLIDEARYLAALAWIGGGCAISAVLTLLHRPRASCDAGAVALARIAAVTLLCALAVVAASLGLAPASLSRSAYLETVAWGGMHTAACALPALLLAAWRLLRGRRAHRPPGRLERLCAVLLALPALLAPVILLALPLATQAHRTAFASVFEASLWVGGVAFLLALNPRPGVAPAGRSAAPVRRDPRRAVLGWTLASIAAGGCAIALMTSTERIVPAVARLPVQRVEAGVDSAGHARQKQDEEFDMRFRQAVVMLHARRYDHALAALHRLMEIRPDVPELHVNMGYALLGLQRNAAARDFFEGALALRPQQANAYYGLALAQDGVGDSAAALGAMRTYVHLANDDNDKHVRRAKAAIWEWESRQSAAGGVPEGQR